MMNTVKDYEKLSEQYNKMLEERNSLIDDLSWYKAKVSRLEDGIKTLERKNEKLRKEHYNGWKQKDEVINNLISNIKSKDNLLSEFSQHIGNKPSSSTYKYFRAKLDELGIKEGE